MTDNNNLQTSELKLKLTHISKFKSKVVGSNFVFVVTAQDYLNAVYDEAGKIRKELFEEKDYNQRINFDEVVKTDEVDSDWITNPIPIVTKCCETVKKVASLQEAKIIGQTPLNLTLALKQLENKPKYYLTVRVLVADNLDSQLVQQLTEAVDTAKFSG